MRFPTLALIILASLSAVDDPSSLRTLDTTIRDGIEARLTAPDVESPDTVFVTLVSRLSYDVKVEVILGERQGGERQRIATFLNAEGVWRSPREGLALAGVNSIRLGRPIRGKIIESVGEVASGSSFVAASRSVTFEPAQEVPVQTSTATKAGDSAPFERKILDQITQNGIESVLVLESPIQVSLTLSNRALYDVKVTAELLDSGSNLLTKADLLITKESSTSRWFRQPTADYVRITTVTPGRIRERTTQTTHPDGSITTSVSTEFLPGLRDPEDADHRHDGPWKNPHASTPIAPPIAPPPARRAPDTTTPNTTPQAASGPAPAASGPAPAASGPAPAASGPAPAATGSASAASGSAPVPAPAGPEKPRLEVRPVLPQK
ncbi:hypothetical protein LBMAG53_36810 [Planctomycetota bacterium]|nr:hypothetical protein LBMAG53_36810 [Planctomycetota bacterium]